MNLRRILYFTLPLLLGLGPPVAHAQSNGPPQTLNASGQCAVLNPIGATTQSVGIVVSGTFSMTLQPEVQLAGQTATNSYVYPSSSTTSQTTITAAGNYVDISVAGYSQFLLCVSSYTSGSATITLNPVPALNASGLKGGGGAGGTVAGSGTVGTIPVFVTNSTTIGNSLLTDTGTALSYSGTGGIDATSGFTSISDGVHAGILSLDGNTTAPAIPSNSFGFLGPNSASFTSYFLQPPSTAPSGTQVLGCGTPSSGVSACTWATPAAGTVTTASVTTANGVSATVATPTTTPAFSFTLGAITPSSVNGLTLTALTTGFSVAGGTTSKTLTINNTLGLSGTDSSTLNIGTGGTLGTFAYQSYAAPPAIGGTTPAAGAFTTLTNTGIATFGTGIALTGLNTMVNIGSTGYNTGLGGALQITVRDPMIEFQGDNGSAQLNIDHGNTPAYRDFAFSMLTDFAAGSQPDVFFIGAQYPYSTLSSGISSGATSLPLSGNLSVGKGTKILLGTVTGGDQEGVTYVSGTGTSTITTSATTFAHSSGEYVQVTNDTTHPPVVTSTVGFYAANGQPVADYSGGAYFVENSNFQQISSGNWTAGGGSASFPVIGWNAVNAVLSLDSSTPQSGATSLIVTASAQYGGAFSNRHFNVQAGHTYRLAGYAKTDGTCWADLNFNFSSGSGSFLGSIQNFVYGTSWTYIYATGIAPTGSSYGQIVLNNTHASGSGVCEFANIDLVDLTQSGNIRPLLNGTAYTNATTSYTNVSDGTNILQFAVGASTNYSGQCTLTYKGSATTAAPILQFTGPASPTTVTVNETETLTSGGSATFYSASTSGSTFAFGLGATAIVTTATDMPIKLDFGIVNGANAGTVILQAKSNGTGTVTIENGSGCFVSPTNN